jgi:hypothetical protein
MNLPWILRLALLLTSISIACAEEPASKSAISGLLGALKAGNLEAAQKLVYQLPGQEERMASRLRRIIESAKAAGAVPEVSDTKEATTVAMAIVKDVPKKPDGKPDYDGVLLLKREKRWLVVMDTPEVEDRVLSTDERKELASLREWEELRRKELDKEPAAPKSSK